MFASGRLKEGKPNRITHSDSDMGVTNYYQLLVTRSLFDTDLTSLSAI